MHNVLPDKLPYDPEKFVNRQKALAQILEAIRQLAAELPLERRVFFACGERGCGKTWFLRHLAFLLAQREIASLYVDLVDSGQKGLGSIRLTAEHILDEIQQASNPAGPFVLLVDNVDDASPDLVGQLEERVLAPAAQQPRTLIVIAERGGPRHWSGPEFREKSTRLDLGPFETPDDSGEDYVKELIERQNPHSRASLDEVKEWGQGYPWSTYLLACHLPAGGTALQECALLLLGDERKDLYPYLEALSILRAFDDVRMGEVLHVPFPDKSWDYVACLEMRKRLLATTIVHWVKEKRGYVIDKPLRLLLETALRQRDERLWRELHCVAYRLYEKWAAEFEQSRADWAREQEYHANVLRQHGYDPAHCQPLPEAPKEGGNS